MLGNFSCLCCRLLTFFKIFFVKNDFRNTIRVLSGLDPDQDRCFVGPDLGPNCLQRLSADAKVFASKERVNIHAGTTLEGDLGEVVSLFCPISP